MQEFLPGSSDMGLMAFRVEKIKDEMGHKGAPAELQAFVMDVSRSRFCWVCTLSR